MSKRKILIIIIFIFVVIGIPITIFASKNLLQYNDDGKLIIFAGEEIPQEVEDGTPIVIAVPNTSQMTPDEFQQNEKEEFMKSHSDLQNIVVKDKDLTSNLPKVEIQPFEEVLYKYYGKEEIENIYSEINKELNGNYTSEPSYLTKSQRKIFDICIEIINSNESTNDEKNILIKELKELVDTVADQDIVEKINNL